MKKSLLIFFVIIAFNLMACSSPQKPGKNSSAFLPNLPAYNMTDAIDVIKNTNILDRFAEFVTGQSVPNTITDLADTIFIRQLGLVQNYLECIMGRIDAFSIRFYSHKELKNAVGAVLSVNWDRFANVANQVGCLVTPNLFFNDAESDTGVHPCADAWDYQENGVRYYFIYVGTSVKICEDFANSLPRSG